MEMEKIKRLINNCLDNPSYESYDLLEETLRESRMSVEELNKLKEDVTQLQDEQISLLDEMTTQKRKANLEYDEITEKFQKLNCFEEERKKAIVGFEMPSILTMLMASAYKAFSINNMQNNMQELRNFLLTMLLAVTVIGSVSHNKKRLKLINKLENIGDLDDLMMHYYNAAEQDKGCSDVISLAQKNSNIMDFCLARIDNVIYDAEAIEEEPIQYIIRA